MSRDEIEKLKALAAHGVSALIGPVAKADSILRLLEERERLLEALDEAEEAHGGECVGVDKCHMRQRMQAAIAFAEAPASKEGT